MPRIVKNGVVYTKDTSTLAQELVSGSSTISQTSGHLEANTAGLSNSLTSGSSTIQNSSGKLEVKAAYVMGDTSTGDILDGIFKIYSGTADPSASLGQNGDIYLKRVSS